MKRKALIATAALLMALLTGCGAKNNENTTELDADNNNLDIEEAYNSVVESELEAAEFDEIYYGYGLVNDDDIPELFIIKGTSHSDKVRIYSFNGKETYYVGDFGGNGSCEYIPQKSTIISEYGNQGFFYKVATGINENGKPYLKDIILRDGSSETCRSYYGFKDLMGDFTGSMPNEDNIDFVPGEEYLIEESFADMVEADMRVGAVKISVDNICSNIKIVDNTEE